MVNKNIYDIFSSKNCLLQNVGLKDIFFEFINTTYYKKYDIIHSDTIWHENAINSNFTYL